MVAHIFYCFLKVCFCLHVSNGAKETGNNIELTTQIKISHITLSEMKMGKFFTSDLKHIYIDIDPRDGVTFTQGTGMRASTAGNIE